MKKDITNLFCFIDDFVSEWERELKKQALSSGHRGALTRIPGLTSGEIITIMLLFHESPCRNFKFFYTSYLSLYRQDFPAMPTYERFVALMPRVVTLLAVLLCTLFSKSKGTAYIDATSITVCHPKRISRNKVFKGIAALGKTTKGWFFGLKLHAIINEKGSLIRAKLTPGNRDDRSVVSQMTQGLTGLLFGDKGYISKELFLKLYRRGLKLVTGIKKSMQNFLMPLREKRMLRKRSIIETVFDYLKNKLQLEHTRHRSPVNALIHILSTLVCYQLKPSKPSVSMP